VVFGLFGFVWMKAVYEPGCALYVSPANIFLMVIWLILCMTGAVGPIANTAHLVGLAVGMLSGYASAWWNGFGGAAGPGPEPGPTEPEE
jgi:GlpG protein